MRLIVFLIVLSCGHVNAQSPGEITFWESVRDSKNPAELRAYLQQYPNGTFKALAEARLAALEGASVPAQPQSATRPAPPPVVAGPAHKLQAGDSWAYRLSYPRLRGQWGQPARPPALHTITLTSLEGDSIVDRVSVDGKAPQTLTHGPQPTLLAQGASIFSPYLQPTAAGRLGAIAISEPGCERTFACEAKGRIAGTETVKVPAGTFVATKVIIDQEWRPRSNTNQQAARGNGGRTLTVWYAPEIGRAVKYSSRLTVGEVTPMDANFDLELMSYQLK